MAGRIETLLTAERRLLQDVSHELRSPLTRLRFVLQLARSSADPKEALARVDKEVDRLATLIGELLHITRAEGDPASRNISAINLSDFVRSLVEDSRIEAEARGCELHVDAPAGVTWAGDRELLHRAVESIVRNAIEHAPKASPIEVALEEHPSEAMIRVRDFGLGLAIAKRAVEAHSGAIRDDSHVAVRGYGAEGRRSDHCSLRGACG